MRITILSIAGALLGTAVASVVPLEARQDTLLPFEVAFVGSERRSGSLGSHPWRRVIANFTDPNPYPWSVGSHNDTVEGGLKGVNCEVKWFRSEAPEGRTWPCDPVDNGWFGLQILPGNSGPADGLDYLQNFNLRLIHGVEPSSKTSIRVEADVALALPSNKNSCLKSGWCIFRADNTPFPAPITSKVQA
ncbi:hypothetical protein E8E13_004681 [Curvularia kusanoi]|uniref:Uncharacterized protein n=1 Tax=Curvularia kusanoi TaxID=90978 RepID=A0A9P4T689_CURKU|nr:hypothetical protein E8E13_004681 [Curvularia kusanoi]